MSFQDVDRRRSSRKCWPFRARTTCTRNKQDTNGNFFHPQLLWRPALPPIIGDTTRRWYDIRFGRCPRQRFSIPHPSSVRISGGSIPNPKNRESIHFGYFGQWVVKYNIFLSIKNPFFSNESWLTIRNIWESTKHQSACDGHGGGHFWRDEFRGWNFCIWSPAWSEGRYGGFTRFDTPIMRNFDALLEFLSTANLTDVTHLSFRDWVCGIIL